MAGTCQADGQKFDLLYAGQGILAVNKPPGLLSVPGRGDDKQDCLSRRVQEHYPEAKVVHRLDMPTSGIMLMALGSSMQRLLSQAFQSRMVEKQYVAVVDGILAEESGIIDKPIVCDWPNRPKQIVDYVHGKPSQTRYRVLERDQVCSTTRVALVPLTGRTHQLRVHMQFLGFPILGDNLYAAENVAGRAGRLLLHAQALALSHPVTGEYISIFSECPF